MRGLRENGWSLKGIARIYGITPFGVKLMIHEKDLPLDPVVFGPECVDGHD